MKNVFHLFPFALAIVLLFGCAPSSGEKPDTTDQQSGTNRSWAAPVREMTDKEYPDNPDISIRHDLDGQFSHPEIRFTATASPGVFNVTILPGNEKSSQILMEALNIVELIPGVPEHIKQDAYLERIGIINQEWNRTQAAFGQGEFKTSGGGFEKDTLVRVDIARNCLNAGLWELVFFANQEGKEKPVYHGWFNFPLDLYAELFEQRNNIPYEKYKSMLENWVSPPSERVNLNILRRVDSENPVKFVAKNDKMYPIEGERKKKYKNIIYPKDPKSMSDFLTDDARFASFISPGLYSTTEPRVTELGRFANLQRIVVRKTTSNNPQHTQTTEFEMTFNHKEKKQVTRWIFGGIDLSKIPSLPENEANKGWHKPIGIANHGFSQSYKDLVSNPVKDNPYFSVFLDQEGRWLDSHSLGIDAILMHFDDQNKNLLHLWPLSFERHAFVGHYVVTL